MSVTYQRPEINSFNDLATSSIYKAAVAIGSIQEIDLMVSNIINRYNSKICLLSLFIVINCPYFKLTFGSRPKLGNLKQSEIKSANVRTAEIGPLKL